MEFVRLEHYIPKIQELSNDKAVPKYATHLVYLTSANNPKEIEHKIIYSILNKKPKRADIYWFVHVDTMDDPYTVNTRWIISFPMILSGLISGWVSGWNPGLT